MSKTKGYSPFDPTDLKMRKYLMASFLYYRLDESIIADEDYDKLCKDLLDEEDAIDPKYVDRNNFDAGDLEAGTGFNLKYRLMDVFGAAAWYEALHGHPIHFFYSLEDEKWVVDAVKNKTRSINRDLVKPETPKASYLD